MEIKVPKLSLIIPTCNRGKNLDQLFASITELNIEKCFIEILLIDNASTDNTKQICFDFIEQHGDLDIRYFYEPVPGLLSGRHLGATEAKTEIFCFLDDDVELNPDWAKSILQILSERQDIDLLTGPNLPKYEVEPPTWLNDFWQTTPYGGKHCGELSLLDLGEQIVEIDAIWVWGLNFIIRRPAYEKLRGFHPDVIPQKIQFLQGDGETGLSIKANEAGMKSLYHYKVMLYHLVPKFRLTPEYFEKRYFYQGIADSYTALRYQNGLYKKKNSLEDSVSLSKKLKRFIKKKYYALVKISSKHSVNYEITNLKAELQKKYEEGYAYHQHHYNTNPLVREWVLKPDYMDYKLPDIK